MHHHHDIFMQRCLQLAVLGQGTTQPNPMVGAVLVYNDRIIGEGYHQKYGEPHAEVHCIASVADADKQFIKDATLYVSLEPCSHHGKTPPCTDLILKHQIKKVVIGATDANPKVAGVQVLQKNGVEVVSGVLATECVQQNEVFFYNQLQQKSFFTAKFACSADGFLNDATDKRTIISNEHSQRLVHRLRAHHAGILVGSQTFIKDKPKLSNRLYGHRQPVKIVVDRQLSINWQQAATQLEGAWIVVNTVKEERQENIHFLKIDDNIMFFETLQKQLFQLGISSVLVEGGSTLLSAMLSAGCINKIIRITNTELSLNSGVAAPIIPATFTEIENYYLSNDFIQLFNSN